MPYGNCDSCGSKLEYHGHQRGDLVLCDVCKRNYDGKGMHVPAPTPAHKDGQIRTK